MNRLEKVKQYVTSILLMQNDLVIRNKAFIHLFGVSSLCSLLALKRNLNTELCAICGLLHDIYKYKNASSTKLSSATICAKLRFNSGYWSFSCK